MMKKIGLFLAAYAAILLMSVLMGVVLPFVSLFWPRASFILMRAGLQGLANDLEGKINDD